MRQTQSPTKLLLPNEIYALECLDRYEKEGITVDKTNGEFAHCPVPRRFDGTRGYYLTHEDHQKQGLIQANDFGTTTFHHGDVSKWIANNTVDPLFIELYEKWKNHHNEIMVWNGVGATDKTRDTYLEERVKGGKSTYEKRVGLFSATFEQKQEWGRKGGSRSKGVKKRKGHKVGQNTNSQKWKSLVDGYVSTAAGVVSYHKGKGWDTSLRERIE